MCYVQHENVKICISALLYGVHNGLQNTMRMHGVFICRYVVYVISFSWFCNSHVEEDESRNWQNYTSRIKQYKILKNTKYIIIWYLTKT